MTGKITKDIIFTESSDGVDYTVNSNATRQILFSMPTKSGYSLRSVTVTCNQNYITTGIGITGSGIYVNLHNGWSAPLDVKITLHYTWERTA